MVACQDQHVPPSTVEVCAGVEPGSSNDTCNLPPDERRARLLPGLNSHATGWLNVIQKLGSMIPRLGVLLLGVVILIGVSCRWWR